ncbi:uncharacterized protein LOC119348779 isoform X2 [Triticum dicoccoides]|uniref:uncharacterized protein LOC119348779 isoform X2 n=1 Tax=Triticum dicoccoides TaxID=85692 RepID=UPI001890B091|nr:uncharacterized protein LOC119348779 isoform X2 [Triticum dicoccoides]
MAMAGQERKAIDLEDGWNFKQKGKIYNLINIPERKVELQFTFYRTNWEPSPWPPISIYGFKGQLPQHLDLSSPFSESVKPLHDF